MNPITLAQAIPTKVRSTIYSVLLTVVALEAIFDVAPDLLEGKLLEALTVLGFGVAASNVKPT